MGALKNKIDFLGIIVVEKCNPNGDPSNVNRPRKDIDGFGEISPECLKRKIRNRLQDMGEEIFVQNNDRIMDGCYTLKQRMDGFLKSNAMKSSRESHDELVSAVCEKWIDIRAFGQVIPVKKGDGVTLPIRGPVSITFAKSIEPIFVYDVITMRSANWEESNGNDFGRKSFVEKGVYVFTGGITPYLAQKTGFSEEDAEKIKESIFTLFENDASSYRPVGSMTLAQLYWWKHKSSLSACAPIKLFRSIKISPAEVFPYFHADIELTDGIEPEIYTNI